MHITADDFKCYLIEKNVILTLSWPHSTGLPNPFKLVPFEKNIQVQFGHFM